MYTLATKFLDSQTDTAALVRKSHKSVLVRSAQQVRQCHPCSTSSMHGLVARTDCANPCAQEANKYDPFKLARLPGDAWKSHSAANTPASSVTSSPYKLVAPFATDPVPMASSSRDPLPPIPSSK